ncbi:ABC transporter ATP-binding protein [Actinoallomurus iriomotensis]|uniref:ABC transporter ATP-binding protein n=1 Tax=Actinoallomurus iriomotensis TaxID=478107 RepID=A0A9W6W300_9ACTN|nr:ABC transporter ATP-binding protein [Actinoallomurus iriomotensis]GLY89465.1 ABC transporter ATP-binding protein [Actinoallomurus iriomotensis]
MSTALETKGLGMRYGRTWALRDCSLRLPTGSVIALVGPNGAGKTTLLQLVTGLLRPTEGTVEVLGRDARAGSAEALARVGFVAQEHPLYQGMSVADLLRMGRSLNLRWDQSMAERRLAGLGVPLAKRAGALSGGQQAQVALALALAKRPALLVLDEPLANLDPIARRDFMRTVMTAVAEDEITVLLSSHVIADLESVCDRLVLLKDGRMQLAGAIDDVLADHRILTGPRTGAEPSVSGLVRAVHSDRHTDLLVRTGTDRPDLHPAWRSQPVGLEELILAYLERPAEVAR